MRSGTCTPGGSGGKPWGLLTSLISLIETDVMMGVSGTKEPGPLRFDGLTPRALRKAWKDAGVGELLPAAVLTECNLPRPCLSTFQVPRNICVKFSGGPGWHAVGPVAGVVYRSETYVSAGSMF